jgi:zona occludens toxin (predicted ATPase)
LNNPGNFFEIESSWCYISTNEHRSCSSLFKSKKILFSFFMFHLTM